MSASSDLELERLNLKSSVAQCEENQKNLTLASEKEKIALQTELNDKITEMGKLNTALTKATEEHSIVRGAYERLQTQLNASNEKDARHIAQLNDTIGAQKKIVNEVDQRKKEVEAKTKELVEMQKQYVILQDDHALMIKQEQAARVQLKSTQQKEYDIERNKLISDHRSEIAAHFEASASLKADIDQNNKLLAELDKRYQSVKTELTSSMDKIRDLEQKNTDMSIADRKENTELQSQVDEISAAAFVLEKDVRTITAESDGLKQELEKLRSAHSTESGKYEQSIQVLRAQLDDQRQRAIVTQRKLESDHKTTMLALQTQSREAKENFAASERSLKQEIANLNKEKTATAALVTRETQKTEVRIQKAMDKYEKDLKTRDTELAQSHDRVMKSEQARDMYNTKYTECDTSIREIRGKAERHVVEMKEMEQAHAKNLQALQSRLDLANKISTETNNKLTQSEKSLFDLAAECDITQRDLKASETELKTCNTAASKCSSELGKLTSKIQQLEKVVVTTETASNRGKIELQSCMRSFGDTQALLAKSKEDATKAYATTSQLQTRLTQQDQKIQQLVAELERERGTNQRQASSKAALQKAVADLTQRSDSCQGSFDMCRNEVVKLTKHEQDQQVLLSGLDQQITDYKSALENESTKHSQDLTKQQKEYRQILDTQSARYKSDLDQRNKQHQTHLETQKKQYDESQKSSKVHLDSVNGRVASLTDSLTALRQQVDTFRRAEVKRMAKQSQADASSSTEDARKLDQSIMEYEKKQKLIETQLKTLQADLVTS